MQRSRGAEPFGNAGEEEAQAQRARQEVIPGFLKNRKPADEGVPDYISDPHIAQAILHQARPNVEARLMRTRMPAAAATTGTVLGSGLYAAAHGMIPGIAAAGITGATLGAAALPLVGVRAAQALVANPIIAKAMVGSRIHQLHKRAAAGKLRPRDKRLLHRSFVDHAMQQNIRDDFLRRHAAHLGQQEDQEAVHMHEDTQFFRDYGNGPIQVGAVHVPSVEDYLPAVAAIGVPAVLAGVMPSVMLKTKGGRKLLYKAMSPVLSRARKRAYAGKPLYASPKDFLLRRPAPQPSSVQESFAPAFPSMHPLEAHALGLSLGLPDFVPRPMLPAMPSRPAPRKKPKKAPRAPRITQQQIDAVHAHFARQALMGQMPPPWMPQR